jgi:hypothetical protein
MEFTPLKLNIFLFFKLPSAFWSGVRVKSISKEQCIVTVKHRWFNQNPFKSMYFAGKEGYVFIISYNVKPSVVY